MDKKLGKNIILSMGYNILTVIVPLLTAPYLGRVLGAEGIGSYTYVQAVASYFVMFGILGMRNYGNRTIAKVRDNKEERSRVFWQIFTMQLLTGVIALAVYVVYLIFICRSHPLLAYIETFYVATAIFTVDWFCEGMEQFSSIAKRTLVIKALNLICVFAFIHTKNDVVIYTIIMSVGYLIASLLLWPTVFRNTKYIKPKWKEIAPHFKANLLLFVPTIAVSVYQTMDKIMIGAIASKSQLAYYDYADKINQVPMLLFTAMGAVMLSRMSHMFSKDAAGTEYTIAYSMDLSFAISSASCFGLIAISNELINIYYGPEFSQSAPILSILAPTIIIYGWANVLRMQYIVPNSMDSIYVKATVAGAVINFILNAIFIPQYSAFGATIGTIAAQTVVALIYTVSVRKKLKLFYMFKRNIPILVIGVIMFAVVKLVQNFHSGSIIGLFLDLCVGIVSFLIMYCLYGKLSKKNLSHAIVSNIWGRKV